MSYWKRHENDKKIGRVKKKVHVKKKDQRWERNNSLRNYECSGRDRFIDPLKVPHHPSEVRWNLTLSTVIPKLAEYEHINQ